jgi:DNA repair protein RadA/Sms
VTKDGGIAGPRVLEHLVDVVLVFEGDRHSSLRLLRATKNRYGTADEVGCFEMREDGIAGLADPSGLFLSQRSAAVPGTCVTVTIEGRRPMVCEVQALTIESRLTSPRRSVTGLDAGRVAMLLAVMSRYTSVPLVDHEVYAGSVGGISTTEPAADLAIFLAMASAARNVPLPQTLCVIGEVSLSGDIRRVSGLERRLAEAARLGFTVALVPAGHVGDTVGPAVQGIATTPVATVTEAMTAVANLNNHLAEQRRPALRSVRA